jgi:arylsulfatase A-like enzyme
VLLHAHYLRPFDRVNSLKRMLEMDGYDMVVSYDDVLRQVLPEGNFVALDTHKPWVQAELGSSLRQLESVLDHRQDRRPVFFYAQPKNVHAMADNQSPRAKIAAWAAWAEKPGFNRRISFALHGVDQSIGDYIAYLKSRGMYDNSIIIVTSDHGEATGELGRGGHGIIFPEVMRVPLIIHLPKAMRDSYVYDPASMAALTDITPTLYYLLGHRPVKRSGLFGHPLFVSTQDELATYARDELFVASDYTAWCGLLTDHGRYLFTVSVYPSKATALFDLQSDPQARHNLLLNATPESAMLKSDGQRLSDYLREIAGFYGYGLTGGRSLVANH